MGLFRSADSGRRCLSEQATRADRRSYRPRPLFMNGSSGRSPDVNACEEEEPDHIDEVPIPGRRLKTEMLIGPEVAGKSAKEAHDEEDRSDDDMETVETGRHEEGRAVDVAAAVAAEGKGRMRVFIGLNRGKQHAQKNGERQAPDQASAIIMNQRMMSPCDGRAGGEQDERVEQRQMIGVENLDALRRPLTAGDREAGCLDRFIGIEARIEEGPEPGHEEHHFRGDEQNHPIAEMKLDDTGVIAAMGLEYDIAPPHEHRVEHAENAEQHDPGLRSMHPHDRAHCQDEGGGRADDRPGAWLNEMIIVLFGVAVGHGFSFSPQLTVSGADADRPADTLSGASGYN